MLQQWSSALLKVVFSTADLHLSIEDLTHSIQNAKQFFFFFYKISGLISIFKYQAGMPSKIHIL